MILRLLLQGKSLETRRTVDYLQSQVKGYSDSERLQVLTEIAEVVSHLRNSKEKDYKTLKPQPRDTSYHTPDDLSPL